MKENEIIYQGNKLIATSYQRGVRIELNNVKIKNALDVEMSHEAIILHKILQDHSPRFLLFQGIGDVFSAGGDLEFLESLTKITKEENEKNMFEFYKAFLSLTQFSCPTIAYINGHAVGAGFCFAMSCDLRVAVNRAKCGVNFTRLALAPGMGGEYWLRQLPSQFAKEMILTGSLYLASELAKYNIFNFCGEDDEVEKYLLTLLNSVASTSRIANKFSLRLLRDASISLDDLLCAEAQAQASCLEGGLVSEAIVAVKEKRTPHFDD